MPQIFSTSRAEATIYRFPLFFYPVVMLLAVVLQAYLPLMTRVAAYLDFPLLVVVYLAMTGRNQVTSMLGGSFLGLLQDSLSNLALGVNGIAKTLAGYLASSMGVRIDADHPGVRLLVVFALYWMNALVVVACQRYLMARPVGLNVAAVALAAFINGLTGMFLFRLFDRFRRSD